MTSDQIQKLDTAVSLWNNLPYSKLRKDTLNNFMKKASLPVEYKKMIPEDVSTNPLFIDIDYQLHGDRDPLNDEPRTLTIFKILDSI